MNDTTRASPAYAWVVLGVVYLASVAAPLNQSKVPPLLPVLMEAFHLDLTQAGSLMSVFAMTGFAIALPASLLLQRLGVRLAGAIALGCLVIGSSLGALATEISLLLASRVIEGTGMGLLSVIAPAAVAMWFPPERRGAPMGLWATWVPVGGLIAFFLSPPLAARLGWQSVWWLGAAFSAFALGVYALLMRAPAGTDLPGDTPIPARAGLRRLFSLRDLWLMLLAFLCFSVVMISPGTFYPTFLVEVRRYSLAGASAVSSLLTFMAAISAMLAGWLADRSGSLRRFISLPFLGLAVLIVPPFFVQGLAIPVAIAALGLLAGAIPATLFAAAPEAMPDPSGAGLALALVSLAANAGNLAGPLLFGGLVEAQGWVAASAWLIPFCLLGFLSGWLLRIR